MRFKNIFNRITPLFFFDATAGGGGDTGKTPEQLAEEAKAAEEVKAQEKLNKEFADRAQRAADAKQKEILETLGVKDPDEAKRLIEAAKKAEADNQSELEKEKTAREKAEADLEAAKQEADNVKKEALKVTQDTEIKISALAEVKDKDGKVVRAAFRKDALDDILLLIDRSEIETKDGKVEGVENALSKLAKAKPYLLGEVTKPTRKGGPREGGPGGKKGDDEERTPLIRRL